MQRVEMWNLYGPTEVTIACTGARMLADNASQVVSIGKPFFNMRAYVLDAVSHTMNPLGTVGELCFAGIQVSQGYHNRTDLTAEKFILNPYSKGNPFPHLGIFFCSFLLLFPSC